MNYGKKSTAKKRTALISRSSMMGKRARVSFISPVRIADRSLHRSNLSGCRVFQRCDRQCS